MSAFYSPFVLIFFGFLPSLIWLSFYLRKGIHPEPKYLVSRVFLMGIMLAPLAVIGQWLFGSFLASVIPGYQASTSAGFFLWSAFIEEAVKLLAVRLIILNRPEFDAPVDAIIYMIAAGLGFAAIENILVLIQSVPQGIEVAMQLWIMRFLGATLLHAIASGITGYFLAVSWFYRKHSPIIIGAGLALATIIHFAFNFILLSLNGEPSGLIYSLVLLIINSIFLSILFKKAKERRLSTA